MPTIAFKGKDQVQDYVPDTGAHVLNRIDGKSLNPDMTNNMIIESENLLALKLLEKQYANKVKCIYIDPPYNTGQNDWVFDDDASSKESLKELLPLLGEPAKQYSHHDLWLCMMWSRIKLMRNLLADDGVLLISIDDNEMANLTVMTDELFGADNRIACLIWDSPGARDLKQSTDVSNEHEYVLVYAKDISAPTLFANSPSNRPNPASNFRSINHGWPFNTGLRTVIGEDISTEDGTKECEEILGTRTFNYPKPSALIRRLLKEFTTSDSIVLDAFAGTGTTAQATLELNKLDGGSRTSILIEKSNMQTRLPQKEFEG